jgi:hypothetical protein
MTVRAMRRVLTAEPRWIIALLLAFGLEMLPTAASVVRHRHPGGGAAHVHAHRIAGTSHVRAVDDTAHGAGVHHAPARDVHQHVVQPVVGAAGVTVGAPAPTVLATALVPLAVCDPIVPALPAGHARAPPTLAA